MTTIQKHVANATNELDPFLNIIETAFTEAVNVVEAEMNADRIDIFFLSAPDMVSTEYGVRGYTPGPNHSYIYLHPHSTNVTKDGIFETLLHEINHCMRWRGHGYGTTLGQAMVSEGLACMYEEMHRGSPPAYATAELSKEHLEAAFKELNNAQYDHDKWFYGSSDVPNWFGYTYGYQLCKKYAVEKAKSAIDLVHVDPRIILASHGTNLAS